jgi:hypothetical protein
MDFDINSLTDEQKKLLLGQLQGGQMAPAGQTPQLPTMYPQEDKGFLGNFMQRKILNPLQVSLGMKDSPQDILRRQQSIMNQYDFNQDIQLMNRREALAGMLVNEFGLPANQVENLSNEALEEIVLGMQGEVQNDAYGNPYQVNSLTGERSSPYQLPSELQQYNLSMSQRANNLNQAQEILGSMPPGQGPLRLPPGPTSIEQFNRQKAELKSDRELNASTSIKLYENAITKINGITDPIFDNMAGAGSQRASLNQLTALLDSGTQTGSAQGLLAAARGLGIDLGLNVKDPSFELVFNSIANQIALPLVKSLGSNPTDTDLQLILDSAPGLSKTVEGNRILIETIKLKLDRDEIMANSVMQFQDDNEQLLRTDPLSYRRLLQRKVMEVQKSEGYLSKSLFQLKARASAAMGKEPNLDNVVNALEGETP